jgi:bifunctional DNA-binding transcriptional regulator/antitoxin component of YhaV-PrlF toxin-antitoxin module
VQDYQKILVQTFQSGNLLLKTKNMSTAIITYQGKTTIPENIRQHLRLHDGDTIAFIIDQQGQVILQPVIKRKLTDLKGLLGTPSTTVSLEEMEQTIRERGSKK